MSRVFVQSLVLSHFRSHKRAQVVLDGRPVAVFGANGAGKTNMLEAVSLLSPGRGLRRARSEDMVRRPEGAGWKVSAVLAGDLRHEIVLTANPSGARSVSIDGKTAAQTALARLLRMVWLVPAQDRLWIEGADGRRRFLDRMALSFFPDHAEATLSYEKAMRERNRLLKDGVSDAQWYRALEGRMAAAGARIIAARGAALARIAAAQEDAETAFPAADLSLVDAEGPDLPPEAAALADAWESGRARDIAAGRTLIGPHRSDIAAHYCDKDMPAAQCSTGEQKALLISLVLANARALRAETGTAPLVLLDEVAAHLDADRRAHLFDEISALGGQAWMTGTGAELFEGLGDRAQMFEVSGADGVSAIAERGAE